jgi:hypothetical protein
VVLPSGRHPGLSQGLPANQHTAERQKGLVDVDPLVVPDAQATNLIQQGKRSLNDPAPSAETTAMFRSAHREHWQNVANPQTIADHLRVVRAVTQHAVGPAPWASSLAL